MISQRVTADLQGTGPRAVCSLWAVRTWDGMVTRTWGTRTDPAGGRLPPPSQGAQERVVPALPCSAPRHLCQVPEDPPLGSRMEGLGGWPHAQTYCPGRSGRLPQWAERQGCPSAPADLLCIWDRSLRLSPGEEGGGGGGQRSRADREDAARAACPLRFRHQRVSAVPGPPVRPQVREHARLLLLQLHRGLPALLRRPLL